MIMETKNKELKYEPRFYMNGVGIHHKTYDKPSKRMYFYKEDLTLHKVISNVKLNYDWLKCAKLFGDKNVN
jgi:hypothetical protein